MPLTELQCAVLRLLAANRSPDSYLAGATVVNRGEDTARFSQDIDVFHDLEASVAQCAEADAAVLLGSGYAFSWLLRTPTLQRGLVGLGDEQLRIEWAHDTAFRFFPVVADDRCGYRLHDADAAVNKVLALAGRSEVRDFVDVLQLNDVYLSLGALAWAACGKDPGFTPDFLLDYAARHTAHTQVEVDRLMLRVRMDIRELKQRWLDALTAARTLVSSLPADELGCLYLGPAGSPCTPEPSAPSFRTLVRHYGSVGGAWPVVSPSRNH